MTTISTTKVLLILLSITITIIVLIVWMFLAIREDSKLTHSLTEDYTKNDSFYPKDPKVEIVETEEDLEKEEKYYKWLHANKTIANGKDIDRTRDREGDSRGSEEGETEETGVY